MQNETNYSNQEIGLGVSAGYRFWDNYHLVFGDQYKKVNILPGAVTGIPFISDVFSTASVPGSTGFQAHDQKISLIYSTLDSSDIPTKGVYASFSVDNNLRIFGSSDDYQNYGAEAKVYDPIGGDRYISVARLAFNQTVGNRVPFLEQSILGGETTLRGYGQNRFIDKSYLLLNLEERIRLFRWEVFNVKADWEVAPFIDLGSVMANLAEVKPTSFEFNPGLGIRAVVRPNIVGRIDVGVSRDGPAVFAGLGYPF
jgi:outer membrane protein assembly factor BamA